MTFTVTRLAGSEALVSGTDKLGTTGQTIVSTEQWDELKQHKLYHKATEAFDDQVQEFFKDILDAAAEVQAVLDGNTKAQDPNEFVVFGEGVEGVAAVEPEIKRLNKDSQILRLIEDGQQDRLLWVHDELVITEYVPDTPLPVGEFAPGDDVVAGLQEIRENLAQASDLD